MNSFLDLHSSADYRNTNRPYYTSTWEYVNVATNYLIPFQFTSSGSDSITIETEDTDGNFTDITTGFLNTAAANLVTSLSKGGGGTWAVSSGATIAAGTIDISGYMTSNTFTLTAGVGYYLSMLPAYDPGDMEMILQKGAAGQWSKTIDPWAGEEYFTVDETGSDYRFVLINSSGDWSNCTALNTIYLYTSDMVRSGNYWWYNGSQITSTLSDIFRLRITCGADIFYSDWCDTCGFTDKTRIKIASSYDYGGIKYADGYEQWIYKDATVRRAPKAEIEIVGDKLNGEIIEEKKTTAIRYTIKMKCTESEYEALVHAMGGTLTITDQTGKTYAAVNIELSDPTFYRSNGIVELSFIDSNNINKWTMNNVDL